MFFLWMIFHDGDRNLRIPIRPLRVDLFIHTLGLTLTPSRRPFSLSLAATSTATNLNFKPAVYHPIDGVYWLNFDRPVALSLSLQDV